MHFSVLADPKDFMKIRFRHALEACGYDVFHGCVTAFIGVALLALVPSESCRIFGFICMVMTVNGGFYALWGLPSVMSLAEEEALWLMAHLGLTKKDIEKKIENSLQTASLVTAFKPKVEPKSPESKGFKAGVSVEGEIGVTSQSSV